jgi:hypothetical protein
MKGLKRATFLRLSVFAVILLFTRVASAQYVSVEARLDTTTMLIGDQVTLHFTFTGPAGTQVLWPQIPDTIYQSIQVIGRARPDTSFSTDRKTTTIHQRLLLTSFDSGFFSIPPIPFRYRILPDTITKTAETRMLLLDVKTVAVDTTKAIKPIKGPIRVPITLREILPWILLVLAIAAVVTFIIYYLGRRKKHAPIFNLIPKAELKPHEIALAALASIREKKIWQSGKYKEYYSELTDILRKYIEDRFGVRALESTTDEILEGLLSQAGLDQEALKHLRQILVLADLVKFAKAIPLGGENEESLELGTRFVNETIPTTVQEPAAVQEPDSHA